MMEDIYKRIQDLKYVFEVFFSCCEEQIKKKLSVVTQQREQHVQTVSASPSSWMFLLGLRSTELKTTCRKWLLQS